MKRIVWTFVLVVLFASTPSWAATSNFGPRKKTAAAAAVAPPAAPSAAVASVAPMADIVNATIETNLGVIEVELYAKEAPRTVENFVTLANKRFYDGILVHRVIPGFMIQTGDPEGTGRGGPGYTFADEFSPRLRHDKPGVLSMANSGPDTNGSQFFITVAPTGWLDDKHSVFGRVTKGMDVVERIVNAPSDNDRPLEEIRMTRVSVRS